MAPPPIVPANVTVPPAHTDCAGPALTVAAGSTVMTTVDETAGQGPEGSLVVSVSVTVPLVILGVYVGVSELVLEKVPLGALHVELVALPPLVPASVTDPPEQTVCGGPAFTVAIWFTVITTVDTAGTHSPGGSFVVNVSVTDPVVIEGVYVEVKEVGSEKVPEGALHVALVAVPPMVPFKVTVPPAHTIWAGPALAVATGSTVTTNVNGLPVHAPDNGVTV